ncbi:hypothetical protein LUZ60_013216 [Juncus effusus]|nr:hypothetical protein LUZ60_013216 [Juncus effusus]
MVTQTMSSQADRTEPGTRTGTGTSLSRQSSIYSLTLNEVQTHLGEPLHSMNLEDLIRNIFPETGHPPQPVTNAICTTSNTTSSSLNKKTVDEVWKDIQTTSVVLRQGRQATLGEMTLEDFLSKAGVVPAETNSNSMVWPVLQGGFVGRPVPTRPVGAGTGPILDVVYREAIGTGMVPVTPGRKRAVVQVEEVVEKTVERRQKRMIKNRESAARSRARKQAYTNELENKILRLEEEIERLKKEKETEPVVHYVPQLEPKFELRRTNSSPF